MNKTEERNVSGETAEKLTCAYLVNHYPKVSHSFIRREILALQRQGWTVRRLALRGWEGPAVDPQDLAEIGETAYALEGGLLPLILAAVSMAITSPQRFARALWQALAMGMRAERPLPYHLVYLMEASWFARHCLKGGVRHIHAHFGTNSAEIAALVHALTGIPFSFTVHGPEEFDKPEFLAMTRKIEASAFTVAISSFGRSQLYRWVKQGHWPKIQVVHCGLDPDFHAVPVTGVPPVATLVCVGRLCEQKGQLLLVHALGILQKRGVSVQLVLAGDGEMRADIEAEVQRLGLGLSVRITGWISGQQVREEIQAARAMVLPSFAEGLPVVIMEAMALQRPVLTTYVAGIPELVLHKQTGWLFPAGDVSALADAMQACLETGAEALDAMGRLARTRVLERHDADVEAAKLGKLMRASIEARSCP
jgi:glycosyltransferase involved in cell wall biosynthesis